jgi:hypothetical protein
MTQEEKKLLLQDLCARLPYGVKCIEKTPIEDFKNKNLWKIDRIRADASMFGMSNCYVCYGQYDDIDNIKPYLFPLSSMSEDQKYEFYLRFIVKDCDCAFDYFKVYLDNGKWHRLLTSLDCIEAIIDWFHKNHIDYRGLIPMGLAIDATDKNIY